MELLLMWRRLCEWLRLLVVGGPHLQLLLQGVLLSLRGLLHGRPLRGLLLWVLLLLLLLLHGLGVDPDAASCPSHALQPRHSKGGGFEDVILDTSS